MLPGIARAHLLTLLEGDGDSFALLPDANDAAVAQMAEFNIWQVTRLPEIFQIESAVATSRNGHAGLEGLHPRLFDRQLHHAVVAGFITETALGTDVQGPRRNRTGLLRLWCGAGGGRLRRLFCWLRFGLRQGRGRFGHWFRRGTGCDQKRR